MNGPRLAVAILVLAAVCGPRAVASRQPAIQEAVPSWGETSEGIQLRLSVAPPARDGAPLAIVELPALQVEIRNRGTSTVMFNQMDFLTAVVEIDGVAYRTIIAGSCCPQSQELGPGGDAGPFMLRYGNGLYEVNGGRRLLLAAGTHRVRLVSSVGERWNPREVSGRGVSVRSNLLMIDVASVEPALERQALIDEAVRLGNASPPFVTLVEKYPDAALSAVQQMLLRQSSPTTRANLIDWLSRIPGDEVTEFLRSQLGVDTALPSRSAAGWNLHRRGDPAGLTAGLAAWRELQTTSLLPAALTNRSAPLEELRTGTGTAAGTLITLLATSNDATALEALARDLHQMPLEVRVSAVGVFLRSETGAISVRLHGGPVNLPGGDAGRVIEGLLAAALDDTETVGGKTVTINDQVCVNPRINDLAALVMATRWPARFTFRCSADQSERDAQIARIRTTWRAEQVQ